MFSVTYAGNYKQLFYFAKKKKKRKLETQRELPINNIIL